MVQAEECCKCPKDMKCSLQVGDSSFSMELGKAGSRQLPGQRSADHISLVWAVLWLLGVGEKQAVRVVAWGLSHFEDHPSKTCGFDALPWIDKHSTAGCLISSISINHLQLVYTLRKCYARYFDHQQETAATAQTGEW